MKISVIGGTRGLGKWIAEFLRNRDFEVCITGRDRITGEKVSKKLDVEYSPNNVKTASESDVVIVSVPINVTNSVIEEIAPVMKSGSLMVDVTSVKEGPTKTMQRFVPEGVEFLPSHPMFGPRIRTLDGQVVVLTPINKGKWYNKVINFLKNENSKVLITTPENHDKMMSVVQGLTHFAYINIASTIESLKVDIKESRKFASPIYSLMVDMIARIVAQNPYLAYSIQTENKYNKNTHAKFLTNLKELKKIIDEEDQEKFVKTMSNAAKHLDDLEASLGRSDKAISALTEEIRILKESIGSEVGLRHVYSGTVHCGILKEVSPDEVMLVKKNNAIKLKLSNVEILNKDELSEWKIENYPKKYFDVSAVFPKNCNPEFIASIIGNIDDVVSAHVIDIYKGIQIAPDMISITFRYEVINKNARRTVEELLTGFGAIIR